MTCTRATIAVPVERVPMCLVMPTGVALRLVLGAVLTIGATAAAGARVEARLADVDERWLVEVEPLLEPEERSAFHRLQGPRAREVFRHGFWAARGPAVLERWQQNQQAADGERLRAEAQRRATLIAGHPERVLEFQGCGRHLRRFEIWHYSPWQVAQQTGNQETDVDGFDLIFVLRSNLDPRSFELWHAGSSLDRLSFGRAPGGVEAVVDLAVREGCWSAARRQRLLGALQAAPDFDQLKERMSWPRPRPGWPEALLADQQGEAERRLVGSVELDFIGRYAVSSTILQGRVALPLHVLHTTPSDRLFDRVVITGDVYRGTRLRDSFEMVHLVAGSPPPGSARVELDFFRKLRPGRYTLELRVSSAAGLAFVRERRELTVPALDGDAPPPPGRTEGFLGLTRSDVVVLTTFASVDVLAPGSKATGGPLEIQAATHGGPIAAVEFWLDGELAHTDRSSPYSATVELQELEHEVMAVALDPAGLEMARDRHTVRLADVPFAVVFGAPGPDSVAVEVTVPQEDELSELRCYSETRLLATFERPPFVCPMPPRRSGLSYLRAEARLQTGETAEELLFLSEAPERVDVQLVELYVSVFDRQGGPVTGLSAQDFRVLQNGEVRELERFGTLSELPLNVGLLMDTSSSMGRRLRVAVESAQRFFRNVLTDRDLASIVSFNHDIRVRAPFTADQRRLEYATKGMRSFGSTRLYDGIVYALQLFDGLDRRRALVVLSDGADVGSDYRALQVIEAARRAQVALYPIALGHFDQRADADLERLARETGGRFFRAGSVGELDGVYQRIEEILRSQYLLVFRPRGQAAGRSKSVQVEILRPGLVARAVDSYHSSASP